MCCLMQKVGVLKSKNTHTVCLYLQHRVCWQADVCWHRSEGSAWEEVAPTRPFEGRTAEGCYEGAGQHPFPPQPEPGHLHTHASTRTNARTHECTNARTHERTNARMHTHTQSNSFHLFIMYSTFSGVQSLRPCVSILLFFHLF